MPISIGVAYIIPHHLLRPSWFPTKAMKLQMARLSHLTSRLDAIEMDMFLNRRSLLAVTSMRTSVFGEKNVSCAAFRLLLQANTV